MSFMNNTNPVFALALAAGLGIGLIFSAGTSTVLAGNNVIKISSSKLAAKGSLTKKQVRAKKRQFAAPGGSQEGEAWDKFCELEFGRDARYPDKKMLDWCLSI